MVIPKAFIFFLVIPVVICLDSENTSLGIENTSVGIRSFQRKSRFENIICDTDGGADDMVALIMAIRNYEVNGGPYVAAVTCTRGRLPMKKAIRNVAITLKFMNKTNIPIFAGEDSTLIADLPDYPSEFGNDGLGDVLPPDDDLPKAQKMDAVTALLLMTKAMKGKAKIIAMGPLKNIAMAQKMDNTFLSRLDHLVFTGGSIRGNGDVLAAREFNAYYDAFSLKIILDKSTYKNVYLMPYELTVDSTLSSAVFKKLFKKLDTPYHQFIRTIFTYWNKHRPKYSTLLSPLGMMAFLRPGLIKEEKPLLITTSISKDARGALMVDWQNKDLDRCNVMVPLKIDYNAYLELYTSLFV